jgi:hypothetical protein
VSTEENDMERLDLERGVEINGKSVPINGKMSTVPKKGPQYESERT